jgi:pyruvate formate lyase activating enzyme
MRIAGWHGTTLVDFPSRVASILFFAGCNLRCPFCHNPGLVLPERIDPDASMEFEVILDKLKARQGFISGVVLTGGEPLMQPELPAVIRAIRELGYAVKLDTNGTWPGPLAAILPWVDYVAMDLKSAPERYPEATGGRAGFEDVARSLDVLRAGPVPWELRTTVVPGLVGLEDIRALVPLVTGAPLYALQPFVPRDTLDPEYSRRSPVPAATVHEMAALLAPAVARVIIRSN